MKEQELTNQIFQNQAIIWNVCNAFYLTSEDREDLFQEIVIQIWKAYPKFEHRSKFSTWLYRVALNSAITFKRKSKKAYQFNDSNYHNEVLETQLKGESDLDFLYRSIEKLNKTDKALVLLYLDDKSYKEISEITGLSIKNVGVKLVRIRKKLNEIYQSLI